MANSVDLATICLGAALGYGLRKEIQSTSEVCRNALIAAVSGAAATAAAQAEAEANKSQNDNCQNGGTV